MKFNFQHYIKVKKSMFVKIFSFFLILILFTSISAFGTYRYYVTLFEQEAINHSTRELKTFSNSMDSLLNELFETSVMLSFSPSITDIMNTNQAIQFENYDKVYQAIELLSQFKTTKSFIESAFIVHRSSEMVISSSGSYSIEGFFKEEYPYENLDLDEWMNLQVPNQNYLILPKTSIKLNNTLKTIVPIVQPGLNNVRTHNLFVINLNEQKLAESLDKHKPTPNSQLFTINGSGQIITETSNSNSILLQDDELLNQLRNAENKSFIYHDQGKKILMITHHSKYALFKDFIYTIGVPVEDLLKKSANLKRLAYTVTAIGLIITLIMAFIMSRILYRPLQNILSKLVQDKKGESLPADSKNEFDYLDTEIGNMISNTTNLQNDLSIALPVVFEQYLLRMLNQNEFTFSSEVKQFLDKHGITFRHENFLVLISHMHFSESFYSIYSREEQIIIITGTMKLLKNTFPEDYQTRILTMEKNNLCLIINVPSGVTAKEVTQYIEYFHLLFDRDAAYIEILTGIGNIYSNFNGMHTSYQEANKALSLLTPYSDIKIKVFKNEKTQSEFNYTLVEENKLYNYLMSGYQEKANGLLSEIVNRNANSNISTNGMKELYLQIYKTGQRVLLNKNHTATGILDKPYDSIHFELDFKNMSTQEITKYIKIFFDHIIHLSANAQNTTIDIEGIIEYIHESFTNDIYLDQLAEMYSTSPQYLSRLIKKHLGVTFYEYLSTLRIKKAKHLLKDTDHNIKKISSQCGFNSHATFIRMFKKIEGITPTEFRNIN